jgi:hypothetical protein
MLGTDVTNQNFAFMKKLTHSNTIFLPPTYSPALIYFGLERGRWITCPYYTRKTVGQAPTAERENKRNKKTCQTSSDIGAEQENHNVGRGPTLDRKGLRASLIMQRLLPLGPQTSVFQSVALKFK